MKEKTIRIDYIARVEGQGALDVRISREGRVEELKLRIYEPPRFFEAFLVGRKYDEVMELTSRICGICPIAHQIAALQAVEAALGVEVSQQTRDLRRLLAMGGIIQSHVLNLYFLALPDLMGYESVIAMAKDHPEVVKRGVRLKKVGDDLAELIGGRTVHPVTAVVKGFTSLPKKAGLDAMKARMKEAKKDALETLELFSKLDIPRFVRRCEHIAVSHPEEYGIYDGRLASTEGLDISADEYRDYIFEKQVPYSTAKHSWVKGRNSFLVGPLARVNINFDKLSQSTQDALDRIGFKKPSYNPFMSLVARAAELIHYIDEGVEIIERLPLKEEDLSVEVRAGATRQC